MASVAGSPARGDDGTERAQRQLLWQAPHYPVWRNNLLLVVVQLDDYATCRQDFVVPPRWNPEYLSRGEKGVFGPLLKKNCKKVYGSERKLLQIILSREQDGNFFIFVILMVSTFKMCGWYEENYEK